MVVNEIRSAVIDTINFIIPPFGRVLAALLTAYYVTYGHLTDFIFTKTSEYFKTVNVDAIKANIDKLYLSSVVPVIFILLLVAIAYIINRISYFLSSLVPLSFTHTSSFSHHYHIRLIWNFFPEIKELHQLEFKINDVLETMKADKKSHLLDQLEFHKKDEDKGFSYIYFVYFLFIISILSFCLTKYFLNLQLSSAKLFLFLILLILVLAMLYASYANLIFQRRAAELWIVEQHLRKERNLLENYHTDSDLIKKIEEQSQYTKKWWWIALKYRWTWIKRFKEYEFPFYRYYIKWKMKNDFMKKSK